MTNIGNFELDLRLYLVSNPGTRYQINSNVHIKYTAYRINKTYSSGNDFDTYTL